MKIKFAPILLVLCLNPLIVSVTAAPGAIKPVGKDGQPLNNEFEPAKVIADSPPADIVPFAGLSPQEACDKASLPPGFKMHVFAGEPDVKQPIAFCLDDRGRDRKSTRLNSSHVRI